MPITLLPDSTVRAIGSSLALNDASSVVKELLDNALDARATVVTIEIASNTLDVIQVKDDGIGISPQDRQFVCQPNSTSKLETITELKTIGGKSLGFRGQALASVAELSSHVTVTTRISGDVVASRLQYNRAGRLVRFDYIPMINLTTADRILALRMLPIHLAARSKSKNFSNMYRFGGRRLSNHPRRL